VSSNKRENIAEGKKKKPAAGVSCYGDPKPAAGNITMTVYLYKRSARAHGKLPLAPLRNLRKTHFRVPEPKKKTPWANGFEEEPRPGRTDAYAILQTEAPPSVESWKKARGFTKMEKPGSAIEPSIVVPKRP
jgi:hypothetical protein